MSEAKRTEEAVEIKRPTDTRKHKEFEIGTLDLSPGKIPVPTDVFRKIQETADKIADDTSSDYVVRVAHNKKGDLDSVERSMLPVILAREFIDEFAGSLVDPEQSLTQDAWVVLGVVTESTQDRDNLMRAFMNQTKNPYRWHQDPVGHLLWMEQFDTSHKFRSILVLRFVVAKDIPSILESEKPENLFVTSLLAIRIFFTIALCDETHKSCGESMDRWVNFFEQRKPYTYALRLVKSS